MGIYLEKIKYFLQNEDILDSIYTYTIEHLEILAIVIPIVFILTLSLWTMLVRLEKKGWIALIPVYRFWILFRAVGLSRWLSLLFLIPISNLIMRVIFYVYVVRKFSRSYAMVPFLVVMPLFFLPIVAFGDGKCPHVLLNKQPKRQKHVPARSEKLQMQRPAVSSSNLSKTRPASNTLKQKSLTTNNKPTNKAEEPNALTMAELRQRTLSKNYPKVQKKARNFELVNQKGTSEMPVMKQGPRARAIAQIKNEAASNHRNRI